MRSVTGAAGGGGGGLNTWIAGGGDGDSVRGPKGGGGGGGAAAPGGREGGETRRAADRALLHDSSAYMEAEQSTSAVCCAVNCSRRCVASASMMLGEFDSSNTEKSVVSCAAIAEMEDSATNARKARVMCTHTRLVLGRELGLAFLTDKSVYRAERGDCLCPPAG